MPVMPGQPRALDANFVRDIFRGMNPARVLTPVLCAVAVTALAMVSAIAIVVGFALAVMILVSDPEVAVRVVHVSRKAAKIFITMLINTVLALLNLHEHVMGNQGFNHYEEPIDDDVADNGSDSDSGDSGYDGPGPGAPPGGMGGMGGIAASDLTAPTPCRYRYGSPPTYPAPMSPIDLNAMPDILLSEPACTDPPACQHTVVTLRGSNMFVIRRTCVTCGFHLSSTRRPAADSGSNA